MSPAKFLFFLGCVTPYRVSSYEISSRKILKKLGVELVEMPDFNCCGFPTDPLNHDLMLTLAARDLCLAEKEEMDILTLCNGCFSVLNSTNKELIENKELRKKINDYLEQIGMKFKGEINVKHLVHVLVEDVGYEKIKEQISHPLTDLQVAQHGGCHLVRPVKHIDHGDDPENPIMLKDLISITGAECLDYLDEPECCGNPVIGVNEEVPFQMAREKLENLKSVRAQALITVCPYCHLMYDLNQPRIERKFNQEFEIPVLHYPQLLALAMGFPSDELQLNRLRVRPDKILNKIGK